MTASSKITYSSAAADMGEFHKRFDDAIARLRAESGKDHPLWIDGEPVTADNPPVVDVMPADSSFVLGRFAAAGPAQVQMAIAAARRAQRPWGSTPWQDRVRILRRAAELVRERKYDIAALMSLEVGKSRMESMGDAEESADLIDYYCTQLEEAQGFVKPLGKLSPNEKTSSVLRPWGVFACIAPFNFPMALSTGMSSAALLGGNAVVFKPPQDCPWTPLWLYRCYADAGVPRGVFNYVSGRASEMGQSLWRTDDVDGIVFTGSKDVGMRLAREFSTRFQKPVLMELGGKNAAIVTESADLDMAAEGVMKSAFGLQGQKCSACSRVYVDRKVAEPFLKLLLAKTAAIVKGDPSERDVYFGPVINAKAVATFEGAARSAKDGGGEILAGGGRLTGGVFDRGHFVEPTIAKLPLDHEIFMRELFVPFLSVGIISGLDEALREANKVDYGLTAGIFSAKKDEIDRFFDEIEAGCVYANRRSGATTGAWPGVNTFVGWKGSGSSGKGGCGPYYVAQFMREQGRTLME